MPMTIIQVDGKEHEWSVHALMTQTQVDDMRADGVEVGVIENKIPFWVADAGLIGPWCFFQDLWNFKNPFRN